MKILIVFYLVFCQSFSASSQQFHPDFSKDYPFPDNATPFVYQKKRLPQVYRRDEGGVLELEEVAVSNAGGQAPKHGKGKRIYTNRLPYDYELFVEKGKQGIKNSRGEILIAPLYDELNPFGWIVIARLGERTGILDGRGEIVLPFQWQLKCYFNGYALLSDGTRAVVYNEEWKLILDKKAEEAQFVFSYVDELNLYKFKSKDGWKVFDIDNNNLFNGFFDGFKHFKNDIFALSNAGKWWLFTLDGKKLSSKAFKEVDPFSREYLDVFVVREDSSESRQYYLLKTNGLPMTDVLDEISTVYDTDPRQDWVKVKKNNHWGILNYKGEVVLPLDYDKIEDTYNGYFKLWKGEKITNWLSVKTGEIYNEIPQQ